jgi:hypothetical protein
MRENQQGYAGEALRHGEVAIEKGGERSRGKGKHIAGDNRDHFGLAHRRSAKCPTCSGARQLDERVARLKLLLGLRNLAALDRYETLLDERLKLPEDISRRSRCSHVELGQWQCTGSPKQWEQTHENSHLSRDWR